MLAASASFLGFRSEARRGAGWSRERNHTGMMPSISNGWPVEELVAQSDASSYRVAKAPALLRHDLSSLPHAISSEGMPSLIDVMQEKWFGSPPGGSSLRLPDSSGALSQLGHEGALADGSGTGGSMQESWQSSGEPSSDPSPRRTASEQSHTSISLHGSHSSSRSISHPSMDLPAVAPNLTVLTELEGLSLAPILLEEAHTPDWHHDAALTESDSDADTDTPVRRHTLDFDLTEMAVEPPVPHGIVSQQPVPLEDGDGFGTWAGRQKHFGAAVQREEEAAARAASSQRSAHSASGAELMADAFGRGGDVDSRHTRELRASSTSSALTGLPIPRPAPSAEALAVARGGGGGEAGEEASLDEDTARNAAWRWRFGRRWRAEQAKLQEPGYGQDAGDEDTWDDALGYLDACGPGYGLQIARRVSIGYHPLEHSVMGSSQMLLEDDSYTANGSLADTADLNATKQIGEMAKKAHELMQHQEEIERRVSQRWGNVSTAGDSWAGHYLPAVQVASYGSFAYVLLKVSDRSGVNKLLVRGMNSSSEQQLLEAAHREVAQVCSTRRVPPVSTQVVGGGVMEWSRDSDRCLNVSEGRVVMGSHASVQTKGDVARLAGALTRCSLPMNNHITIEGQKIM